MSCATRPAQDYDCKMALTVPRRPRAGGHAAQEWPLEGRERPTDRRGRLIGVAIAGPPRAREFSSIPTRRAQRDLQDMGRQIPRCRQDRETSPSCLRPEIRRATGRRSLQETIATIAKHSVRRTASLTSWSGIGRSYVHGKVAMASANGRDRGDQWAAMLRSSLKLAVRSRCTFPPRTRRSARRPSRQASSS